MTVTAGARMGWIGLFLPSAGAMLPATLALATLAGCRLLGGAPAAPKGPTPPLARVEPKSLVAHGQERIDDYYWLRRRDDPEVIAYLEAENAYTEAMTAATKPLEEKLFAEIKGRIRQDDATVPYLRDGYYLYTRTSEGEQYPLYCRRKGTLDAPEEIYLDVNRLARGTDFLSVRGVEPSPDGSLLAWAADTRGRRIYTIHVRDLATGETLPDEIPAVTGNLAWANDSRTFFYTKQDPVTLRWNRVYRHRVGADPAADALVYDESEDTFSVRVFRTRSKRYLMIACTQTLSSEYRYLDADDPMGEFRVLEPRRPNHEYHADHLGNRFLIRSNLEARNFRLLEAPVESPGRANWTELVPGREDVLLEGFTPFRDFLVLSERRDGLDRIRIVPWDGSPSHEIAFREPAYTARVTSNAEVDTDVVRFAYSSLVTPKSVYDYDMRSRERTLRKRDEVLGGYDPERYRVERLFAPAPDGILVPISIVYRKGRPRDGSRPLLLYGYGSYGISIEPRFRPAVVSLLDRGFAYAVAHVRGGQELGRWWYEDGKLLRKKNTFTDFIACAKFLVARGYTSPEHLYARGGSAGGLLMGAVINLRGDLFHGVATRVPFVDVVTTMLDESIPLTTSEYDEWGDPRVRKYYDYMLSYSPYDNLEAKPYPNLLVTTGLHDSQVQYWEPAKWVAKLRRLKTDSNLLLLRTNMHAGHGGASGRYERYRETAFYYAFLLDLEGIRE